MRELEPEEIERLAARKSVRRIAVQNFLGTMSSLTAAQAYGNLSLDARLYHWNSATVRAISRGIELASE